MVGGGSKFYSKTTHEERTDKLKEAAIEVTAWFGQKPNRWEVRDLKIFQG